MTGSEREETPYSFEHMGGLVEVDDLAVCGTGPRGEFAARRSGEQVAKFYAPECLPGEADSGDDDDCPNCGAPGTGGYPCTNSRGGAPSCADITPWTGRGPGYDTDRLEELAVKALARKEAR